MYRRKAVNAFGKEFEVFLNPCTLEEYQLLGPAVRFTADDRTKTVYLWTFNAGHHADVDISLKINATYSNTEVLRGAAQLVEGVYHFVASDFFSSFKRGVTTEDRTFLKELFSKDWSWVNQHIIITEYVEEVKKRFNTI
jgi:hypothetical protein